MYATGLLRATRLRVATEQVGLARVAGGDQRRVRE
jgi:hypothetical protein